MPQPPRQRRSRELTLGRRRYEVLVRESPRSRRLRINVAPGRLPELVVPPGTGDRAIDRMIDGHRDWIAAKTAEMEALAERRALGLDRPGVVWLGGEPVPVLRRGGGRAVAALRGGRLLVSGPRESAIAAVERWSRREARVRLQEAVAREAPLLGVRPRRLSVRDPRTRWGSCSSDGALSFSWRLLLAPPPVLDYVVVHELCHIHVPDHSRRFWALVEAARPAWREQARWLRTHSYEVGEYRPRLHAASEGAEAA
jgi:predicted metal-dependent hydrolase